MAGYAYTDDQWQALVRAGHAHLEAVARGRGVTSYTDLCRHLLTETGVSIEPHDHALPHVLGDIATRSFKARRLALTALVLYKDGSEAGPGFYSICQQLGLLPKGPLSKDAKDTFHIHHMKAIHEAYAGAR